MARNVFLTALLMCEPYEVTQPLEQFQAGSLEKTGFIVPPGWYGMASASGIGIVKRSGVDPEEGMAALDRLGMPDPGSRSVAFEGRRLVRVNGGFIALNYDRYREKDYGNAERCRRYRLRKAGEMPKNGLPLTGESTAVRAYERGDHDTFENLAQSRTERSKHGEKQG